MISKLDTFNNHDLFNHSGLEYVIYYDTKSSRFVALPYGEKNDTNLIETPYVQAMSSAIWKEFRDSLDERDRVLAESFEEKHGFFQFMRETGLIAKYDAARDVVAENVISAWETANSLCIDWAHIDCDW